MHYHPELDALLPVIGAILNTDRTGPAKQPHTAKRIFERLRDEHGFGGYTVVKDSVRVARARGRQTELTVVPDLSIGN